MKLKLLFLILIPIIILSMVISTSSPEYCSKAVYRYSKAGSNLDVDQILAQEKQFVEETIQEHVSAIRTIDIYTENLFSGDIELDPVHSYYWDRALEKSHSGLDIPGWTGIYNQKYGSSEISFETSCYYMPRDHMRSGDPFNHSTEMQFILSKSSNMDNILKELHYNSSSYKWMYAMFSGDGHIFRNYPYDDLQYFFDLNDGNDFDPIDNVGCGDIYEGALSFSSLDATYISTVYTGSSGLMLHSLSRALRYPNGTFIGVAAMDVIIESIKNRIHDIGIGDDSYAFMIDNERNVVSHPNLYAAGQPLTINQLEQPLNQSALNSIITRMIDGETGYDSYEKQDQMCTITFVPVQTNGSRYYSIAVVEPEESSSETSTIVFSSVTGPVTLSVLAIITIMALAGKLKNKKD